MNYYNHFLCIAIVMATGSQAMHLDFTHLEQYFGKQKGIREARSLVLNSPNEKALIKPIQVELETTVRLIHDLSEAKNSFSGFICGFALVLKQKQLTISAQALTKEIAALEKEHETAQTKKSRKELVKLLTAELTKEKLLT